MGALDGDGSKHHKSCMNAKDEMTVFLLDVSSEAPRALCQNNKVKTTVCYFRHRWSEGKMPTLSTQNIQ